MPTTEELISQMYFKLDGTHASADIMDSLISIEVDDNLNLPDTFTVQIRDPELKFLDSNTFALGKSVEILVKGGSGMVKLMDGQITTIEPRFAQKGNPFLIVRGYDRCHRLNREKKSCSFNQMTDSDIATKIARKAGLTPKVESTREVHEYVVQDHQSDWEFLWDRAQRIGFRVFVEGNELHFKKTPSTSAKVPVLDWGNNLIEFNPCLNSLRQVGEVIVRGWDSKAKKEIVGRATKANDVPKIGQQDQGGKAAEKAFGVAGKEIIGDRPVFTQGEADDLAQSICDEIGQDFITADGICSGTPEVYAGAIVDLRGVGDCFGGRYRVSHALHRYEAEGYTTEFTVGGRHSNTLVELLSPKKTEKRSPMVGIVTNNQDPDGLGRVKVKLPSRGNQELDWARLVAPGAGKQKGLMWLPDVNDEVLVVFEHEDIHRPFIVGGLWNRSDTPTVKSGSVVQEGKATRVGLETAGKNFLVIVDDSSESSLSIGSSEAEIVLDQKGKAVTIRTNGDVTIESKGKVIIQSSQIEIKSDGSLSLQGAQVEIKSTANMNIEAGAAMNAKANANFTIKGALVQIN
jgi:phage protein D/phage baseplate assembly protein gpV